MSYLALTLESNPAKRKTFLTRSLEQARSLKLPSIKSIEQDEFAAVVGAPHEGVLEVFTDKGEAALCLGYALHPEGGRLSAKIIHQLWQEGGSSELIQPDGYFCAVSWSKDGRLYAAVDPIGLYPFVYTQLPSGSLLCGSAPGFMRNHPDFKSEPDVNGIAGLLLTNGLLFNQTIIKGVRRLAPGHRLRATPTKIVEVSSPLHDGSPNEADFDTLVEQGSECLDQAIRSHAPTDEHSQWLLLSGGRDSRHLAAGLQHADIPFLPLTLGDSRDQEVRAAKKVCQRGNLSSHLVLGDPDPADYLSMFHLAGRIFAGMGGGSVTTVIPRARDWNSLSGHLWHGILFDDVVGGYATGFFRSSHTGKKGPDVFFQGLNNWGFPVELVNQLIRPLTTDSVATDLREKFLDTFTPSGWTEPMASYKMKLQTRGRHHLANVMWQWSFHAWPTSPVCDHKILSFFGRIPLDIIGNRRLQLAIMDKLDPGLLRIPHDSNSPVFLPTYRKWLWPRWRQRWQTGSRIPRYFRVMDPLHPGWMAIGQDAEKSRQALNGILDLEKLENRWPKYPHPTHITTEPFASPAGARSAMCIADWFHNNP